MDPRLILLTQNWPSLFPVVLTNWSRVFNSDKWSIIMKFSKYLKILKKWPHFKPPQLFFHNFPQVKLNWFGKLEISSFICEGSQLGGTRCLKVVNPFFWKSRFFDEELWFFKNFFDYFLIKIISRKNWIIWKGFNKSFKVPSRNYYFSRNSPYLYYNSSSDVVSTKQSL